MELLHPCACSARINHRHTAAIAERLNRRGEEQRLADRHDLRLLGEGAEVQVDQAKAQHDFIKAETHRKGQLIVKDPVAAVAKGHVMNFIEDVDKASRAVDQHLTAIMMAQDFHDLTGQVIAKVVNLAATIEEQLVQLLIQTAPPEAAVKVPSTHEQYTPALDGPVVNAEGNADVVTNQSEVDDLLASLGF